MLETLLTFSEDNFSFLFNNTSSSIISSSAYLDYKLIVLHTWHFDYKILAI